MRVITSEQMREIDLKTMEEYGLSDEILMEHAGMSVVDGMMEELGDLDDLKVTVLCGTGNNGGDGLVVSRILLDRVERSNLKVWIVGKMEKMKPLPKKKMEVLQRYGVTVRFITEDESVDEIEKDIHDGDVIVDAMIGIGFKGRMRGIVKEISRIVNDCDGYVVAVDIPTGVNSDNGMVDEDAIRADLTVTFGLPKVGHVLYPGRERVGKLKIVNIGFPRDLLDSDDIKTHLITPDLVRGNIPGRIRWGHKGSFGKVLVVGGSRKYTGAPVLSALGALKMGCGLVSIVIPDPYNIVATSNFPELIAIPVEAEDGFLSLKNVEEILKLAEKVDTVLVGPGMGLNDETVKFTFEFLRRLNELDKTIVIDADGLNALSKQPEFLKELKIPKVLTPHLGEFSRLSKMSLEEIQGKIIEVVKRFSREWECTLVLKSASTVISDGVNVFINITGNTGLAKGGSGDVLGGMIASLLAQGVDPLKSSLSSVYIHGFTANLWVENGNPERCMTPEDILNLIPDVLKSLER